MKRLVLRGLTILTMTPGSSGSASQPEEANLPDLDALWDYNEPAATEAKFREILPRAEASGDLSYRLQLETQIARTLGLQQRFEEAHRILDEVDREVSRTQQDLRLVQVRALLERGRVFNSAKEAARAEAPFEKAWEIAREIGADGYAVDAAHMMAIVQKGKDAIPWFEQGVALAETSKEERAREWLGPLYNNLGWTYHDTGDYEHALGVFSKSLDWRSARQDTAGTRIAKWCIGRCLRSLGRVEEAIEIQQALANEYETDGQQDGYVEEELGECLFALGRANEAKPHFAEAYALLRNDIWLARDEPERLARLRDLGEVAADSTGPLAPSP